jgi:hypothetical protein
MLQRASEAFTTGRGDFPYDVLCISDGLRSAGYHALAAIPSGDLTLRSRAAAIGVPEEDYAAAVMSKAVDVILWRHEKRTLIAAAGEGGSCRDGLRIRSQILDPLKGMSL